ncbi:hypothetical protein [Streptomyces sp. NPDC005423]|uniref:hypothetical protein n=1 Tax=Streptomyces sp. NPDC005423 TaxID=3155343 RepID=UPI0033A5F3CF
MMYDQNRAQQPASQPPGRPERRVTGPEPLMPPDEREKIAHQLGQAMNHFADTPREALEEAEAAYDEATAQLAQALAEHRRELRASWEDQDPETQSVDLRLALRQYRELTQRLLRA